MSENSVIQKIKNIKNKEIIICVVLCLIILGVFFYEYITAKNISNNSATDSVEDKLREVIGNIDGVGKVSVAITYSESASKEYAYETKTVSNGNIVTKTTEIVSSKGSPVIISELMPKIKGVVVVADGGDSAIVKLKIIKAVITLLDIDSSQIEVFTYKK